MKSRSKTVFVILYLDGDEEIVEFKNCLTLTVRGETYGELADKIAGLK